MVTLLMEFSVSLDTARMEVDIAKAVLALGTESLPAQAASFGRRGQWENRGRG